jgi:hypothetical protein
LIIISTALGCGDPSGAPQPGAAQLVDHSASLELTLLTPYPLAPNHGFSAFQPRPGNGKSTLNRRLLNSEPGHFENG